MKRKISILLIIFILSATNIYGYEAPSTEDAALILKDIGVFKGSDKGFELDRQATRLEGLILLIRLLGKEDDALATNYGPSYFTDVPEWAVAYTNYAYYNGLTVGIGNMSFGTYDSLNAKAFSTFVLRALGYDDSIGDFTYQEAHQYLSSLLSFSISETNFTRGRVADICYESMYLLTKGSTTPLYTNLISSGDIDIEALYLFDQLPKEYYTYDLTIIDADDSLERLQLSIDSNQLLVDATYPLASQYAWVFLDARDRIEQFTGNDYTSTYNLDLGDNSQLFSIYLNNSRNGNYTSWIYDLAINSYDEEFKFLLNPIIARNDVIYDHYQTLEGDYLGPEYQIYPGENQIKTLAENLTSGLTDRRDKIEAIHSYVASTIYYDMDNPGVIDLNNYDYDLNDTMYVLDNAKGICEGYANLAVSLLRSIGIESRKVSGFAIQPGQSFYLEDGDLNLTSNHTWFEAYDGNEWIICDPTWDSNSYIENGVAYTITASHRFFDISIEAFSTSHHILDYRIY